MRAGSTIPLAFLSASTFLQVTSKNWSSTMKAIVDDRLLSKGEARSYLDRVSQQWDDALARLKAFVEE